MTSALREQIDAALPAMSALAFLACGSRLDAQRHVAAALRAIAHGRDLDEHDLLPRLVATLEEALGRRASQRFVVLDNLLRADASRTVDLDAPPISGDLARVPVLLAALKASCLVAALGCVPPGIRLAFILADILGHSLTATATLLRTTESAVRVRLIRARRLLADYLGPRCGHLAARNLCSCAGRLGMALAAGFVELPPGPTSPPSVAPPAHHIGDLYRSLAVQLDERLRGVLLAALSDSAAE